MELKVISFNIRCRDDSNGHSMLERAPRLAKVTLQLDADIIGFQEATMGDVLSGEFEKCLQVRASHLSFQMQNGLNPNPYTNRKRARVQGENPYILALFALLMN